MRLLRYSKTAFGSTTLFGVPGSPMAVTQYMAVQYQIKCINKTDRFNAHERIENVGGNEGGKQWKLPEGDAIAGIENGKWSFFVQAGGKTADVIVATRLGRKYLKTENDGEQPDNLLSLPECP